MTAIRQVAHDARNAPGRPRRPVATPARGSVLAPPAIGLVVSSPAIAAGLSGSASPMQAFGIVVVTVSVCWVLAAAGFCVGRPDGPDLLQSSPALADGDAIDPTAPQQLGRIEPIQVPADEAIPGSAPSSSSTTEGQLP